MVSVELGQPKPNIRASAYVDGVNGVFLANAGFASINKPGTDPTTTSGARSEGMVTINCKQGDNGSAPDNPVDVLFTVSIIDN